MSRRPPLRVLRLANPVVRLVLRSPAHRLLSSSLLLLTYTSTDGRARTIPVMYVADGGGFVGLAVGPEHKRWWRVFRNGAPAQLLVAGDVIDARGRLLADVEATDALRAYLERFPRAGRTLGVGAGSPDGSLETAAAAVAIVAFTSSLI